MLVSPSFTVSRALASSILPLALTACGEGEPPSDQVLEVAAAERVPGQRDDRFVFADSSAVDGVVIDEVGEQGRVRVRFRYKGAKRPARLGLLPPRDAARQLVSQSPPRHQVDPRTQWIGLELTEGEHEFELTLAQPWFPKSAVIVLELREGDEDEPILVEAGPRTVAWVREGQSSRAVDGGRANLGLVQTPGAARAFTLPRLAAPLELDGKLDEALYQGEPMSLVGSLHGEPIASPRSEVWMGWDAQAIYVAARLQDRDIWGDYAQRDDPIYREEAFEVFFGAGERVRRYLEFQVSPRSVVFDAAFTGPRKGGEAWNGQWSASVEVDGTLDDRRDRDREWTVELAFPWSTLCGDTEIPCDVAEGTTFRMNVFRLDKDAKGRQSGQALTPTRKPDFHNWAAAATVTLGGAP